MCLKICYYERRRLEHYGARLDDIIFCSESVHSHFIQEWFCVNNAKSQTQIKCNKRIKIIVTFISSKEEIP